MDELVQRIVAAVGVDPELATKAIGIILGFLQKEGPPDAVSQLLGAVPGAQDAIDAAAGQAGAGGLMGGLMGMMGGGGIMGVANQLMGAGLSMGQVQSVTREVVGFAREKGGDEPLGQIAAAIPGLSQFL
jgi:hypothetical protein